MNPILNKDPDALRQIDIVKIYHNKRCLVIDDFPQIRGSLSRTLKTFGAEAVDTAADGEEAVKLCCNKTYDIVLCDYNLGSGKDGHHVLEEVRHLRVLLMTSLFVMITGESSRQMVLGALECQPDDYITKPYTQASLRVRLNRAIVRHQALLHIKRFVSKGKYDRALEACNEMIATHHRYSVDCIRIKGQLHFLLKQLDEAKAVYESVLSNRPTVWAKLGMAKTQIAMEEYDEAEELLKDVIEEDERYVEAHDMLTEVYVAKNDLAAAQKATEDATHISPKSCERHRRLAKLAEQNHDDDAALKSFQQSIKWGQNSCHESEQDYFNYARKVSEMVKGDNSHNSRVLVKNANSFLERARKRYAARPDVAVQAQMLETQILLAQSNTRDAEESHAKAKAMYSEMAAPNVETSLEFARSLHAMDEEKEAREFLTRLAARHSDDPAVMQIIDGITGEPITDTGKTVAADLTKRGIDSYEDKQFEAAIEVFNEALTSYPKHVGLNLNLVQAILAGAENRGFQHRHEAMVKRALRAVGELGEDHKQYHRYQFLIKQMKKHYPDALMAESA